MRRLIKDTRLLFLLLIFLGIKCESDDIYQEIPLGSSRCFCDHPQNLIKKIFVENVLLFDAEKLTLSEMIAKSLNGEKSNFISFSPETDSTLYYNISKINISYNNSIIFLCNFPEEAKEWNLPIEGIYVSFSANVYEACFGHPDIAFNSNAEAILLTLKKKIK